MEMLKASNNQLPFLARICICSLRKRPKNMIIYESKDADESATQREREREENQSILEWICRHKRLEYNRNKRQSTISTYALYR
jgi:hypothetical protein